MSKKTFSIAVVIIALLIFKSVHSQVNQTWKWVHPKPQGSDLNWIKAVDSVNWVTAGNGGTFMKTTNAGATWNYYINAGGILPGYGYGKNLYGGWFFNANTGFVCGIDGWIAKTTNGGASWDSISSGTAKDLYGMFFINTSTGFVAGGERYGPSGSQGILLKTTNGGAAWDSVNYISSRDNANNVFALDQNHIYVALDHVVFIGGFFRGLQVTTDGGASWVSSITGPDGLHDVLFLNPDTGFVCGRGGVVKRTTDGGANWVSVNPGGSGTTYFKLYRVSPSAIYVVGNDVSYRTTNLGNSWTAINPTTPNQEFLANWYSLCIYSNTMVVAGQCGLVNKSTNSGANWTPVTNVTGYSAFFDVWCETGSGKVWAVGMPVSMQLDRVLYSSNGGVTWTSQQMDPDFNTLTSIYMLNSSTGFVCGAGGEVRKTTNGGTNWNLLTTGISSNQSLSAVDFIDVNTGWVFSNSTNSGGNIWKTTNGGTNWSIQNSGLTGNQQIIYAADMTDANTGWFVNEAPGKPYKTTNGGVNWVQQSLQGSFTGRLNDIKMLNAMTGYICGGDNTVPAPGVLYRTTNGGAAAWETVSTPFSNIPYTSTDWLDVNTGVLGSGTGLVAKTINGGSSWSLFNTTANGIHRIYLRAADTAYAVSGILGAPGTPLAILKFEGDLTNITGWNNSVPENYFLAQNFPNPFNPVTEIKFGIPKAGNVSLKVYDITGRLVKEVIKGFPLNAGTVTQRFDGTGFASGIYFYTLMVDNKIIDTKKMILVK